MKKHVFYALVAICFLASCSVQQGLTRQSAYPNMYKEQPLTLLIMPPINNTTHVNAKEYLYTTLAHPLLEKGYYVISPRLGMEILQNEGAYDAELFVDAPLTSFKQFFNADAVIFSEINKWDKQGFGISMSLHYWMKSTSTNEILFERNCDLYLDLSSHSSSNSLLGGLVDLAVSTAKTLLTDEVVAARKANIYIFKDLPHGNYSPNFGLDQEIGVDKQDISITLHQ